jgi:hypothetical protein
VSLPWQSNWPLRTMCMSSITASVIAADQKDLKPCIGRDQALNREMVSERHAYGNRSHLLILCPQLNPPCS